MKKKIFTLMTLLLCAVGMSAQITTKKWDFTSISDSEIGALTTDVGENTKTFEVHKNGYIQNVGAGTSNKNDVTFVIKDPSGNEISTTEGLVWGRNKEVIKEKAFRIYTGTDRYIYFNYQNGIIQLPSIKGGQEVVVTTKNYSGKVTVTNGGEPEVSNGNVTFTVTDDGAVSITFDSKLENLQAIEVRDKATVSARLEAVKINGVNISDADLSTLNSTKALSNATAYVGAPSVTFTSVTTTNGVEGSPVDAEVVAKVDGDNYSASLTIGGSTYKITFTNVTIETVLNVTEPVTVPLTQTNITSKEYLSAETDNWSSGYYNMSMSTRKLTIKVKGAKAFYVGVKNGTTGRQYTIKIGEGEEQTVTHNGNGIEPSGVFAIADPSVETTIVLAGKTTSSNSVYPQNIYFYADAVDATIETYEWATFSSTKALDFAGVTGVKAYFVTGVSSSAITTSEVAGTIPASTGILLNAQAGTYTIPVVASSTTNVSDNKLVAGTGAAVSVEAGKTKYVLSVADEKAVFKKIAGTAATVDAGKAYLEIAGASAPQLSIFGGDDDQTTGISGAQVEKAVKGEVYDLQGRRVQNPTKGLYIVGGKKVVVK